MKTWAGLLILLCLPACFSSPGASATPSSSLKTKRDTTYYTGPGPVVHQELSHYYDEAGNQLYYKDAYQQDPSIFYEEPSYSPDAATAYAGHGGYEDYEGYYATDPYYQRDPYYQYGEEADV